MASNHLLISLLFLVLLNTVTGTQMSSYIIFFHSNSTTSRLSHEAEWLEHRIFYTYDVLQGIAARLTEEEAHFIANVSGVTAVMQDQATVQLHTTHSPEFLGLNANHGLWHESNFGEGVIIGLVDTGIWPEAESFSDAGIGPVPTGWKGSCEAGEDFNSSLCNRKLIGAKYFNTGLNHLKSDKVVIHFADDCESPRDGSGHGTHTASTAAGAPVEHADLFGFAKGTARGIASKARVAMYKACNGRNGCSNSDILAAMESAIKDGVHILSLSISGPETPYYDNMIARGGFAAMERGIFVACAAGNEGPRSSSVVNTAPWLTTVGAGSIDRYFPVDVVLGNGQVYRGSSLYASSLRGTNAAPLAYVGSCDSLLMPPYDFIGKIVVCAEGKIDNAFIVQAAGGAGFIQLNAEDRGGELIAVGYPLPSANVGAKEGKQIVSYINSTKNPIGRFVFYTPTSLANEGAPALASFSSRGPNPIVQEILKPDLLAPGVNILAAFSPVVAPTLSSYDSRRAKFNIMSGTSMACPHVAGAAALLRATHPSWSPAAIRSALMTTAGITNNKGLPIVRYEDLEPATALGIGSGQINPELAANPGLIYDVGVDDYISFLCSLNYTDQQMKFFIRVPNPCFGYAGSPGNLNYPSFSVVFRSGSTVQELNRTLMCVGELLPEVYQVSIINLAAEKVTITVEPQHLTFNNAGEKQLYKIKFEAKVDAVEEMMVFGSILWASKRHRVRSPIAITWSAGCCSKSYSQSHYLKQELMLSLFVVLFNIWLCICLL